MGRFSTLRIGLVALLASSSSAHFLLNFPPTIGFSDDDETTAPCGGFTVDFATDNVTDFHVGGDSIAVVSRPMHQKSITLTREKAIRSPTSRLVVPCNPGSDGIG